MVVMINTTVVGVSQEPEGGSAARLIDAALRLFAHQGFDATTVGDIERAAGFAPRSGVLYKYFASKRALLDAGLEQHLAAVGDVEDDVLLRPLDNVRSEITLLARWLLAELDRERHITHLLEREGDRLSDLRDRARDGISERGYIIGSALLERWMPDTDGVERDALAVVAIGAVVNFRRSTWTFGAPPRGLSDDEFIDSWVNLFDALIPAPDSRDHGSAR